MDRAFVEHTQNDINGEKRDADQQWLALQRSLKGGSGALETAADGGGKMNFFFRTREDFDRVAQRHAGRQIEGNSDGGELPLMVDRKRRGGLNVMRDGTERDGFTLRGFHVDIAQGLGRSEERRVGKEGRFGWG